MRSPYNWGADDEERARRYPCDDLGFVSDEAFFRAVFVAAPPELVYRWVCQLRAAPYSYDVLDNFARRSPPYLVAGLDRLAAGQRLMTIFRLAAFEPGRTLTVTLGSRSAASLMGDFAGTYDVRAVRDGSRLLAKVLVRYPEGPYGRLLRRVMPHADLFMFRKQLLTLKRYAERDARDQRRSADGP